MKQEIGFLLLSSMLLFSPLTAMHEYTRAGSPDPESQVVPLKRRCSCNLFRCLKVTLVAIAATGGTFLGWKTNNTINNFDQLITEARGQIVVVNTTLSGHQSTMEKVDHVAGHIDDLFHQFPSAEE